MINKRLHGELKNLYENFNNIQIIKISKTQCRLILNNNDTIQYTFLLSDTYPFTKPKIFMINNTFYESFLKINIKYKQILKNMYGLDCLCCSSIYCADNWAVSYQLSKFIDEFKINLQIKQKIYLLYLLNFIKIKYNIHFNTIETFL